MGTSVFWPQTAKLALIEAGQHGNECLLALQLGMLCCASVHFKMHQFPTILLHTHNLRTLSHYTWEAQHPAPPPPPSICFFYYLHRPQSTQTPSLRPSSTRRRLISSQFCFCFWLLWVIKQVNISLLRGPLASSSLGLNDPAVTPVNQALHTGMPPFGF